MTKGHDGLAVFQWPVHWSTEYNSYEIQPTNLKPLGLLRLRLRAQLLIVWIPPLVVLIKCTFI